MLPTERIAYSPINARPPLKSAWHTDLSWKENLR